MVESGVEDFAGRHAPGQEGLNGLQQQRGFSNLPRPGEEQRTVGRRLSHPGKDLSESHPPPLWEIGATGPAPPGIILAKDRKELNKDMLLVGRFARAGGGNTYGGDEFTERVLRWERQGNRILLRSVTFEITADSTLPVYRAVRQASYPPVVAVFPIESYAPDSSPVIDVTRLYTTNVPEFVGARGSLDEKRSFIERVNAFPDNIEVEATQTATPENPPESQRILGPVPATSILAHWSMVRLPERPMMPRIADKRVGYFTVTQTDYGTTEQRAVARSYITRWKLEKKFPDSSLSDPVRPIVYYIDPATPAA